MIVVVTLNKQQVIVHKCKKKSRIVVLKTPRRDQAFNIDDPKKAKLLAYTSLCRPMLENAKWDPLARDKIYDIELVQNSAIISNLKERKDNVYLRQWLSYSSK